MEAECSSSARTASPVGSRLNERETDMGYERKLEIVEKILTLFEESEGVEPQDAVIILEIAAKLLLPGWRCALDIKPV